jgi:NDP-sugar pyrophosphorylase family protein
MKPSLLIMAAGMGSRYGGLKQMEALGPGGTTLLDYSVHDAVKAGFGKVVFVIRRDIEDDFKKIVGRKWEAKVPTRYVFQELSMVPDGFRVPEGRKKPWGTGHAIWVAQAAIQEPFAVINADDYYGRDSFKVLGGHLSKLKDIQAPSYSMVGFKLKNTLSEHGTVSRGVCQVGAGYLKEVVERVEIGQEGRKIYYQEGGERHLLKGTETVSMNMWGFTPRLFGQVGEGFVKFMKEKGGEEKSEFLIPRVVDALVRGKKAKVKVLPTKSPWFGVTYPEDKSSIQKALAKIHTQDRYRF